MNVFGDLPGSGESSCTSARTSTTWWWAWGRDDGSGVTAMLEAARMLVGGRPRTIRFCGFGRGQLSEGRGSMWRRTGRRRRTRVVLNLDSMAAITGRNQFLVTGPEGWWRRCAG